MTTEAIFYFSSIESLRRYGSFRVDEVHQARPHQNPASVTVWSVVGKVRDQERQDVVAEFGAELPAKLFRDMAEIVARD